MQYYNKLLIYFFLLINTLSFSQVKIGQWVDHLCYTQTYGVAKVGSLVYVSNGSGLATYNTDDNSIEKMTKIDGLSDIGVQLLRKNDYNNVLLVVYKNSNIDVIKDGIIINIPDIKRKIVTGKKYINEVYFNGKYAYISCGFGIIIFDTEKLEIKDTYYVGNGILNKEIYQTTRNDTAIFAATESGIYYGTINSNLNDFTNWKSLNTGLANGPYNAIVNFNGKIITNYSERLKSNTSLKDTLYEYTSTGWVKYSINGNYQGVENKKLYDYSKYNKLLILDQWGVHEYNATGQSLNYLTYYGFDFANINDVCFENNGIFWVADNKHGLIKSGGSQWSINDRIGVNGPNSNLVNDMDMKDGLLAVAPLNLGDLWNNTWIRAQINIYNDKEWKDKKYAFTDTISDINCVAIDPNDKNHIAYGSWGPGLIELQNENVKAIYNTGNSSMVPANGSSGDARIGGLCYDENSNLWVVASLSNRFLNVLTKSGTWINFNFLNILNMPINPNAAKVIIDKKGLVWVQFARSAGMLVFNPGPNFSQPNNSNTKYISVAAGSGALPTNDIYSMVEDKNGNIWVGTGKGIAVFYNTDNIFSGANWDSQKILIEQDGHVQILLENDAITSIAIDGNNRKWIGTEGSGVYCLSPDGQKEIFHFTESNGPLYSNTIRDIVVDEKSGDVFIATDQGIQSYRTSIIKGFDDFTEVHAYPNPIKPSYSGNVYITGLIDESDVKITDIAGNVVWATKSQGGQIEWNLKTFSGTKASTGVYMVYCASANGDKSATTKLLIVN